MRPFPISTDFAGLSLQAESAEVKDAARRLQATHKLQDNGRYAHDGAHARQVFEAAGLLVEAPVEAVLREEKQVPVRGWLVVARRRT